MGATNMLATISLNDKQADLIRLRFYNNNKNSEFCELVKCFPKFAEALVLLPNTSGFRYCNVMLREMVEDIIRLFGFDKEKIIN